MKHEKRLALNALRMTTRELAHAHLKERLHLPQWYGNNLDALSDCLGDIGEATQIILRFAPQLEASLGDYGVKLIRVMQQAAEQNANLRVTIRPWL